jgi:hypothetical protein
VSDGDVQYRDDDIFVKVRAGHSRDRDCPTSDFIIGERSDHYGHQHVVIDDYGHELFNGYRVNTGS